MQEQLEGDQAEGEINGELQPAEVQQQMEGNFIAQNLVQQNEGEPVHGEGQDLVMVGQVQIHVNELILVEDPDQNGGDPAGELNQNGGELPLHNVIQLGMVRTFFTNPVPTPPDNLLPVLAPKMLGHKDEQNFELPKEWLGFFSALLHAPTHHKWAKQLLDCCLHHLLKQAQGPICQLPLQGPLTPACKFLAEGPLAADEIENVV